MSERRFFAAEMEFVTEFLLIPPFISYFSSSSIVPLIATELSLGALIIVVAIFWTTLDMEQRQGTTSFTMQEWWWAFRDGYLGSVVKHQLQNGGL